jgi:predicted TIM-barrel fold metal-dependent hydrolase
MSLNNGAPFAIDADGHLIESNDWIDEFVEPAFRDRAPRLSANADGKFRFHLDGESHPAFPEPVSIRRPMTPANRIKVLDNEGIRSVVLFPSCGLLIPYVAEGEAAHALTRGLNDWLADYRRPFPDRLHVVGMLALHDVGMAVAEARRAIANGAVALAIRPNPCHGRTLDDPAYDPLYAAIEELGVPLVVHEATGCPDTAGGERYGMRNTARYTFNHVISHPFEQMFAALSIICGGVLEKFPRLRVGFFEAGCSWVPYWLARLDAHFDHRSMRRQMPLVKLRPSEYFRRQCVVTCDPDDPTIPLAIQGMGAEAILFASDYPHFDSGAGPLREFMEIDGIADSDRHRILHDNAAAFFGIEVGATV